MHGCRGLAGADQAGDPAGDVAAGLLGRLCQRSARQRLPRVPRGLHQQVLTALRHGQRKARRACAQVSPQVWDLVCRTML